MSHEGAASPGTCAKRQEDPQAQAAIGDGITWEERVFASIT